MASGGRLFRAGRQIERSGGLLATRQIAPIVASREDAREVLVETDAGFFGDARGVGIDGLEKALDFLLHLFTSQMDDLLLIPEKLSSAL
jgi:hypothetical protein